MFAIPGILALLVFLYLRPQEYLTVLARVPFLYLFLGLAIFGLIVDVRLGHVRLRFPPVMKWALAFLVWTIISLFAFSGDKAVEHTIFLGVPVLLFCLVCMSVQSFRAFRWFMGTIVAITMCLTLIGLHQAQAELGCVAFDSTSATDVPEGAVTGRSCRKRTDCYGGGSGGSDYMCEHIGLFGTTSIEQRIRFRGILKDPNELALAVSVGLAVALGFGFRRRKNLPWLVIASILVGLCVILTKSRGGTLVILTVGAVFFLRRYSWKGAVPGALVALPILLFASGSERRGAEMSSDLRLEAWSTALDLFVANPASGVGAKRFTKNHHLTAHNSYLLVAAELGIPGLLFFVIVIYLSFKTTLVIANRYRGSPEAAVAVAWAHPVLAAIAALAVGSFFLSMSYHALFWIVLGFSSALYGAIKVHDPDFEIRVGPFEAVAVLGGGLFLLVIVRVFLAFKGF